MKTTHFFIPLLSMFIICSCGKDDGGTSGPPAPTPTPKVPEASTLLFPENNTECNEGSIVSVTESEVTFNWSTSENTDSYTITVINLSSNTVQTETLRGTEKMFRLMRGTPYEWFVESRNESGNVKSVKWRFFNEGPGIENYAPFPPEAISPKRGSTLDPTSEVTLEWSANDVDNDLKEFEIYLGTTAKNVTLLATVTKKSHDISVKQATDYYWRVRAIDNEGNSANSEIFEFRIN